MKINYIIIYHQSYFKNLSCKSTLLPFHIFNNIIIFSLKHWFLWVYMIAKIYISYHTNKQINDVIK
jgi:hypothetical protein